MPASPSTDNYTVLKGELEFDGVDLGNAPKITLSFESETLDHFSSREGIKMVDLTVLLSTKVNIAITLDELSEHNLRLAWMANASGTPINLFSLSEREGPMIVTGTNDIGTRTQYVFPSVSLLPVGDRELISEEWATLELSGTVNAVAGVFGTMEILTITA